MEAQNYLTELFNREEELYIREEIKKIIDNSNLIEKQEQEKVKTFSEKFDHISTEIENMKKIIEKDMNEIYEGKLHTWVEKLKKQNQELWEQSLKYVKTDFKEIGYNFFSFFSQFFFKH